MAVQDSYGSFYGRRHAREKEKAVDLVRCGGCNSHFAPANEDQRAAQLCFSCLNNVNLPAVVNAPTPSKEGA